MRSIIARVILGDARACDRLGSVTLHPHQMIAARRLEAILDREGGALLSDVVGLGKTYTALAIAASRGPLLVIAPAVLRTMWLDAFRRAGVPGDFVSFEALSRGRRATERHRLVIIDEAHHARNPATRRYDGVARACVRAEVLLLSATPLHNSRADVASLLALFLGSRAFELTDDEVARFVVRRTSAGDATAVPLVAIAPSR
ncbi:MAG TPA: SNF2-related protein, partial [Candidatus Elarobacter sp.]|nr:SNF2-related protein [Candidatus Elarobacter sp.]